MIMGEDERKEPIFRHINADDEQQTTEVESLCMNCHENGMTRLLLTKIPFFKEVILSSFSCPSCNYSDNEVQSAGSVADKGCKCTLKVTTQKDLIRQVVKSDSAGFCVKELEFESPPFTQKGELNTIEGLLARAISGLEKEQPIRKAMAPETAEAIGKVIDDLKKCQTGKMDFTFILDDAAGNSFVENPCAPENDPNMTIEFYTRSSFQNAKLGITAEEMNEEKNSSEVTEEAEDADASENLKEEVLVFPTNCSNCNSPVDTRMKVVAIPHFKEVIIMATTCDSCGQKTNEVKSGSGIEPKGTKITFNITDPEDLSRDVLKSETCEVEIPAFDFKMQSGTLGGRFTTLEGLFVNIIEQLKRVNPFGFGDSPAIQADSMKDIIGKLEKLKSGEMMNVKVILDDAAGNSYLQNYYAPDPDPQMTVEEYERTYEQNDELGLADMKTEGYEEADS